MCAVIPAKTSGGGLHGVAPLCFFVLFIDDSGGDADDICIPKTA